MIKNLLYFIGVSLLAILLLSGTLGSGGSNGKFTGSPLDGQTCTACHSSYEATEVSWISTNIPESGWVPKQTYTIELKGENATASLMGFEITAENEAEKAGTFTYPENGTMKWASGSKNRVTHTKTGTALVNGEANWNVEWHAPDTDMGTVSFYAVFNAANGNGNTSGDSIFTSTLTFNQDASTTNVLEKEELTFKAFPNPTSNFLFLNSKSPIENVAIFDTSGKEVANENGELKNSLKLDLRNFGAGIYIVHVTNSDKTHIQKIKKQ